MPFSESLKIQIRRQSHHSCCLCKRIGVEIHHIVPQEEGGADTPENAAPLCPACHETYGANPTKRKMILEARDLWYEICLTRYKTDHDRIDELTKEVLSLKRHFTIPEVSQSVASEVIEQLRRAGVIQDTSTNKGWPLSKLLEKIARFKTEYPVNASQLELAFLILFVSKDTTDEDNAEYDRLRGEFLELFGKFTARNVCSWLIHAEKLNGLDGFTEPELLKLVNGNFFFMTMLLHHEEISLDDQFRLRMWFEKDDFSASLVKPESPEKRD